MKGRKAPQAPKTQKNAAPTTSVEPPSGPGGADPARSVAPGVIPTSTRRQGVERPVDLLQQQEGRADARLQVLLADLRRGAGGVAPGPETVARWTDPGVVKKNAVCTAPALRTR
jgi:hypothetical protein